MKLSFRHPASIVIILVQVVSEDAEKKEKWSCNIVSPMYHAFQLDFSENLAILGFHKVKVQFLFTSAAVIGP